MIVESSGIGWFDMDGCGESVDRTCVGSVHRMTAGSSLATKRLVLEG